MKQVKTKIHSYLNSGETLLLIFLVFSSGFSTIFQLLFLFAFSLLFLFNGSKIINSRRWIFYFGLTILSLLQLTLFSVEDYGLNFIFNSLMITLFWFIAFQNSNFIERITKQKSINVFKVIKTFILINLFFVVIQIIVMCFEFKTIFPFSSMSAGDNVKGLFRNSSVNQIIMSLCVIYFYDLKKYKLLLISMIIMILTFYMSGLIIFFGVVIAYSFLLFKLKNKIKIIFASIIFAFLFTKISPENIKYVRHILVDKVQSKTDPVRKLVSFEQTFEHWTSNLKTFILGTGGGKFSSRTAFITGGEYVSWFPKNLKYLSTEFNNNHFQLWNKKILSIPYKDGTSNQPFSFYNKIIGEYGLIGLLLFITYWLGFFNKRQKLGIVKLNLYLILAFFLLDYWFEYFTVIIFFELILLEKISIESKTPQ